MANFSIENFGCRATEADAAALRCALLASGLTQAAEHASADIVVLNTCTVTAAADSQAREAVRKIHRANPGARIVVTGCYAQRAPEELAAMQGVTFVVGNSHQAEIPAVIRDLERPARIPRASAAIGTSFLAQPQDDPGMSLARGPAKILTGDILRRKPCRLPRDSDGGRPHASDTENSGWLQ